MKFVLDFFSINDEKNILLNVIRSKIIDKDVFLDNAIIMQLTTIKRYLIKDLTVRRFEYLQIFINIQIIPIFKE